MESDKETTHIVQLREKKNNASTVNVIGEATETSLLFLQNQHPHPGQPYAGLRLCAYLPDSRDGRRVLKLLDKAFNTELLFSVVTNNVGQDVVTPASIPLKTQAEGGIKV